MGRRSTATKQPNQSGAAVLDGKTAKTAKTAGAAEPIYRRSRLARGLFFAAPVLLALLAGWLYAADYCVGRAKHEAEVLNYAAAESWLQRAAWWDPSDGGIALQQARVARRRGQVEAITPLIAEAARKGCPRERLQREAWLARAEEGDVGPLEAHLAELLAGGDDLEPVCEAWIRGMLQAYQLAQAEQMIAVWKQDFPDAPRPYIYQARISEHNSQNDRAEAELRAAIDRRPDHSWAWYELGQLLNMNLRYDDAYAAFAQAAEHLEEPEPALVGMAQALRQLGRLDEAEAVIDTALARPQDRLREMYRLLGDDTDDARAEALAEAGRIQAARENPEAAAGWFEQALAIKPFNRRVRNSYAEVLRQMGRPQDAAEQSARVAAVSQALTATDKLVAELRTKPNNVDARVQVGKTFLEFIDPEQGRYWLGTALKLDPDNVEAHRALRDHYRAEGNAEMARRHGRFVQDDDGEDDGADDGADAASAAQP